MYERETEFLRNLYQKGNFERHAFCCVPPIVGVGDCPHGDFTLSEQPLDLWLDWLCGNYEMMVDWHDKLADDFVPFVVLNTGTQLFPVAMGARAHISPDGVPCAIPFIDGPSQAAAVKNVSLANSPGLERVFTLADKVTQKLGPDVYLSVPDMQSGFDIAAMMWKKEDFFVSLGLAPDAVSELTEKCAALLKEFLTRFRSEFPNSTPCHCPTMWAPPEMGPWVSNDECGMFNTQMFEQFCLDELIDLSQTFGGLGMHCCADAEHQFESFKKIPNFYGFNRVAGKMGYPSLLDYFNDAQSPVHVLAWLEDEDIKHLVTNAGPDTRFIFCKYCETIDEGKAWLDQSRALLEGK